MIADLKWSRYIHEIFRNTSVNKSTTTTPTPLTRSLSAIQWVIVLAAVM